MPGRVLATQTFLHPFLRDLEIDAASAGGGDQKNQETNPPHPGRRIGMLSWFQFNIDNPKEVSGKTEGVNLKVNKNYR